VTKAKRHHFVPRAYLERFGREGRVAVRWRGHSKPVVAGVHNVAVEGGFYETVDAKGQESVAAEEALAVVDGQAINAMRAIVDAGKAPPIGSADRLTLALYIAVQMKRTPESRERYLFPRSVIEYANGRAVDRDLMAEYLEKVHLGFRPGDGEIEGALALTQFFMVEHHKAPTKTDAIQLTMSDGVGELAGVILIKRWSLEIARRPRFITSDCPVVFWRKPTPRDRFRGIGLMNAEEVRFPLDAGHQLVITDEARPASIRVEPARVRASNADVAATCYKFIVGHPDRQKPLEEVALAAHRPAVRFNLGPGYKVSRDGTRKPMGDVIHMRVPRPTPSIHQGR
jgi:hypothetical protein